MLNDKLNQVQSIEPRIHPVDAQLCDTGIAGKASANADTPGVIRQRIQRMRRRHQRSQSALRPATGWVTRMAS